MTLWTAVFCVAAALPSANALAASVKTDHVRVELVSESNALVPGRRAWFGLRLEHEPHWHTYWINPGDSGLPTKLTWQLPAYLRADDISWPTPRRFDVGGLSNFGYSGKTLLPVALEVAPDARRGSIAHIAVEAKWLVCREQCVSGKATLKLTLPVASSASPHSRWQRAFAMARAAQPVASAWTAHAQLVGDRVDVTLAGSDLPTSDQLDAFVVQRQVVTYAPPKVSQHDDEMVLNFAKSEYFTTAPVALDLLIIDGKQPGMHARSVTVPFSAAEPVSPTPEKRIRP